mgnify:CR=1 FL=1
MGLLYGHIVLETPAFVLMHSDGMRLLKRRLKHLKIPGTRLEHPL